MAIPREIQKQRALKLLRRAQSSIDRAHGTLADRDLQAEVQTAREAISRLVSKWSPEPSPDVESPELTVTASES